MSDLALFTGPAGRPGQLRPGRAGLAPCVWEAFVRHVLDGSGPLPARLVSWSAGHGRRRRPLNDAVNEVW